MCVCVFCVCVRARACVCGVRVHRYSSAGRTTEATADPGVVAGVVVGILVVIIVVVIVVVVRNRTKRRGFRHSSTPQTYIQNETSWNADEGIGNYTGVSL